MMSVIPIPARQDNYIWCLKQDKSPGVCIVDPGSADPVIDLLERESLSLETVLITHHHPDHTDGLDALIRRYQPEVIGPRNSDITGITKGVGEGDDIHVMGRRFDVLHTPGHTLDHISFLAAGIPPLLFCADTLFSGGCGRLFEGSPQQMLTALERFKQLPDDTLVFAGHEYSVANLEFAMRADPDNRDILNVLEEYRQLRAQDRPTLPSHIGREKAINPFLRIESASVQHAVAKQGNTETPLTTFTALREWKDRA